MAGKDLSKSKKILIVDDEYDLADMIREQLENLKYSIVVTGSAEECFAKVEKDKFDLILLDIRMPGIDGLSACLKLKDKKIPVIIMTGLDEDRIRHAASVVGASDYITKPFSFKDLKKKIEVILKSPKKQEGSK